MNKQENGSLDFLKVSSSNCVKYNYAIIVKNEKAIKSVLGLDCLDNKKMIRKQFRALCEKIGEQYASRQLSEANAKQLKELFAMFGFDSKASLKGKLSDKVADAIFVK